MAINTISNNGNSAPLPPTPQSGTPAAVANPKTPTPAPQQPSPEQVKKAVESIKQAVKPTAANSLDFSIDEQSGKTVVRVTDTDTGEVIRQIPSLEMLEIARSLDKMQGMLLKQKA